MRNLKKISAVVVALAIMLTTLVPAFAASYTTVNGDKAVVLNKLDLYAGTSTTTFEPSLETELTRGQGAVLLAKLFNMDDAALALTDAQADAIIKDFADADKVPSYAKKRIAYLVDKGIMSGSLEGSKLYIDSEKSLLGGQFATLLLKQMGFTVPNWSEAIAQLSSVEGAKDVEVYASYETKALLRDHAVGVMYGSLTAKYADELETIIEKIVAAKPALKDIAVAAGLITVAPIDLAVESVKAINTKQLEVVFNQAMDKDSAQTESFYEIKDKGTTVINLGNDSAVLSADGKTVIITLDNVVTDKLTNSSTAKVIIKKEIKAANGNKLAANKEFTNVIVQDGIIPSVVKAEATGEYNVKLTFTEPVYGGSTDALVASNFKVMSGSYQYFVQAATLDNKAINLTLGTKLTDGPVTVTVNAAGVDAAGAIRDYAGYKVFMGETSFDYKKDTSVSVVTVAEAKPTVVKLAFSKPVKGTNIKLYHSVNGAAAYLSQTNANDKFYDTLTFNFAETNPVPAGSVKLFLVNSTVSGEALVDGYGVKVPDQTLTANVVVDVTAPAVSSTKLNTNVSFVLTFDEEIDKATAELASNYTFKSVADNKDVYFIPTLDATKKIVTLTVPGKMDDNTQYQVVVKKAKDLSGNTTAADMTFSFTTGDNTSPEIYAADCYVVEADGKIYLKFSEPMNETQMLDKSNYMVQPTDSASWRALNNQDTVTKISSKVVLIDLDEAVSLPDVKVAPIMDLAGKRLFGSVDSTLLENIGVETVKINRADLIATNKVKIVFNSQLSSFSNTDIEFAGVTPGAIRTQLVESMVTNGDGNTEIVLILDKNIDTDVKYEGVSITAVTVANPSSESVSGTKLGGSQTPVTINDKTAPEIVTYDHDKDTTTEEVASVIISGNVITQAVNGSVAKNTTGFITITFTEAIETASLSTLSFKVDGYTVTGISNATANEVVLEVKANKNNTPIRTTVTQVYNITDAADNVFASGSTWTVR